MRRLLILLLLGLALFNVACHVEAEPIDPIEVEVEDDDREGDPPGHGVPPGHQD